MLRHRLNRGFARITLIMNVKNRTIFSNDNLSILRGIDTESIDLIYLDPPFNFNRNYAAPIGSDAAGTAFKDTWTLSSEFSETLSAARTSPNGAGSYPITARPNIRCTVNRKAYVTGAGHNFRFGI